MTKRGGSKAHASAICIDLRHLLWMSPETSEACPKNGLPGAYSGGKAVSAGDGAMSLGEDAAADFG
jgi:hypothetical protein